MDNGRARSLDWGGATWEKYFQPKMYSTYRVACVVHLYFIWDCFVFFGRQLRHPCVNLFVYEKSWPGGRGENPRPLHTSAMLSTLEDVGDWSQWTHHPLAFNVAGWLSSISCPFWCQQSLLILSGDCAIIKSVEECVLISINIFCVSQLGGLPEDYLASPSLQVWHSAWIITWC